MKVLLIGLGQLGAPIAARLAGEYVELTVVDLDPQREFLRRNVPRCLDVCVFDATDGDRVASLLRKSGADTVIYAAGLLGAPSERDPARATELNATLPERVAARARNEGVRHFVYLSSFAVYGRPTTVTMHEEMTCVPVTIYGRSKFEGETALMALASTDFRLTVLRVAGAYGPSPGEPVSLSSRYLHHVMMRAECGRQVGLDTTKSSIDEFVFVDDVAEAAKRACSLRSRIADPVFVGNVGPGARTTAMDLRSAVVTNWPRAAFAQESLWPDFTELPPLDVSKMRDVLGFETRTTLAKGLAAWRARALEDCHAGH